MTADTSLPQAEEEKEEEIVAETKQKQFDIEEP